MLNFPICICWKLILLFSVAPEGERYADANRRKELPELKFGCIEYTMQGLSVEETDFEGEQGSIQPPAFVFLVDATASAASLSCMKSALFAAVEVCTTAQIEPLI
jgi:hypothetical protein